MTVSPPGSGGPTFNVCLIPASFAFFLLAGFGLIGIAKGLHTTQGPQPHMPHMPTMPTYTHDKKIAGLFLVSSCFVEF